ncbi:MAG: HEPN domain-containing protein [Candidatus Heimdallarchaeaceae archaeon]
MSFSWDDFLDLAIELTENETMKSNEEARLRSSISRAYYSVFCKSRNYLIKQERKNPPRNSNVHSFVINSYKKDPDIIKREIGHNLHRLRNYRNKADYNNKKIYDLNNIAQISLFLAEKIIINLKNIYH